MNILTLKAIIFGLLGLITLLLLYFVIMSIGSGSFDFSLRELNRLKLFVIPLLLGFGIQVGLFSYLKMRNASESLHQGTTMACSTTSTIAMIACCAHHLADILPIIGLSAAALFLITYQKWFLGFGILSNIVGIIIMLKQFKQR